VIHRCAAFLFSLMLSLSGERAPFETGPSLTPDDVIGVWTAQLSHAGETSDVVLRIEKRSDGALLAKWSTPVIHLWEMPIGLVVVDGDTARIGSFVLTYDASAHTLTGTIPDAIIPLYSIRAVFRRVDTFTPAPREITAASAPRQVWMFDAGSPIWSDVAACHGLVIVGDDGGRVHALDEQTGKSVWTFDAGAAIRARTTCAGGAAYVHADDGFVTKLNVRSGTVTWKVRVDSSAIARLALDDPKSRYDDRASAVTRSGTRAYAGTGDGRMVALDDATAATVWQFSAADSIVASPLVEAGRIFFGSFDGRLYALDAATGVETWRSDRRGAITSTPASLDHRIIVGNRSYDLTAFNADNGAPVWNHYFWFSWVESTATIFKSMLYIGSSDAARVSAIEPSNGRQLWTTDVGGSARGQPAVTEERVLVAAVGVLNYRPEHRGSALGLDRRTGRILWRFVVDPPRTGAESRLLPYGFAGSPAVSSGRAYFAGLDGRVYAFAQ
jgi:outer membrane protein assembly factor BamB